MRHYPPKKPRQRSWPARNRAAQAKFRAAVLDAAGSPPQCAFIGDYGIRCNVTGATNLVAHHCEPGNPDPATGLALCNKHHRAIDRWAR